MSENTDKYFITLSSYPRAILHIDCDAFFASCEQAGDPRLKGKPIVTGKERGIISCASYEAKAFGVKRGIRLSEAKRLCPALLILPSDYETYSLYSERMFDIIKRFTPSVEEFSIDEAFCDITGLRRVYRASYPEIAGRMKERIQKELGLTVSVGLSLSKTLAKICSRHDKPDGFTAVPGYRLHKFLKCSHLDTVCGFGPNTVELLRKHGIKNVFDYVNRPEDFAKRLLGKVGIELWRELRGESVYKLCREEKKKYLSISKTRTFMPASREEDHVKARLTRNLESACIKLRRHSLSAAKLLIYLKASDFKTCGLEAKLNRHSSSTLDFMGICGKLFNIAFNENIMYRATGVVLSDIVPEGVDSRTLFDDPVRIEKIARLSKVTDTINIKYGKHTLHVAASDTLKTAGNGHPRNNVAWRKQELLKGETPRKRLKIPLLRV
ncbi:MAG: DNA polymerase IV [Candidatus Omnitrophica bacterium]|nr:DNA polymerase IV [Candidatus Omnitrophota bacterium]